MLIAVLIELDELGRDIGGRELGVKYYGGMSTELILGRVRG